MQTSRLPEQALLRTALPVPNPGIARAYRTESPLAPTDLWLAGNEGRPPAEYAVAFPGSSLGRYPDASELSQIMATRTGVEATRVLVTAGADDGLLRLALAYLAEGREIVLPTPTFVMIERYARLAGGTVVEVDWPAGEAYPTDAVIESLTEKTSLVAIVSPNNPTGAVATATDVQRIAAAAPQAVIIVDCAYAEYADENLTEAALALRNAVVLRTLSKAYGCAGLRVGFALGAPEVIETLRAAGNPYPCAAPSLAAAADRMATDIAPNVAQVRSERDRLAEQLNRLGLAASPSQGNFVYAEGPSAPRFAELLTGFGIAVRSFPRPPGGESTRPDAVRITCPGDEAAFERLSKALEVIGAPEALLFDMDGVLIDVSSSYRVAILETVRSYGVEASDKDVARIKAEGDANDDWRVTWRLLRERGVDADLSEVTQRFEAIYQGTAEAPGLKDTETLVVPRDVLEGLGGRYALGIVTGRPRGDAEYFLDAWGVRDLFQTVITRDDAPLKPAPDPTRLACQRLGVRRAWLFGDTPDDIRSARDAGVLGVGVLPPGEDSSAARTDLELVLRQSGAGAVLPRTLDLVKLLP